MQYCMALIQYDLYMRMYSYLDGCRKVFDMEIRERWYEKATSEMRLPVSTMLCLNLKIFRFITAFLDCKLIF